ncbi:hypothetical protein IJG14_06270 [bacterium]|nr:hypothetical protein [bacterium]
MQKIIKLFFSIVFILYTANSSFAVNEIQHIDNFDNDFIQESDNPIELNIEKNSIQDKIFEPKKDKKYSKKRIGEPTGTAFDLFRSSGYTFESGPIKNQKFRYFFHGGNLFNAKVHEDLSSNLSIAANEFQSETLFADNKTRLLWAFNFSRETNYDNNFFEKISFLFLERKINDNQVLMLGEMRTPNGIEGGSPSSSLKLVARSQIARNYGNYVSNGIRNIGKYKYLDYDIGIFDGSRFFNNNFKGYEFTGLASIKPLSKFDGKYGDLKIGGSIDVGKSENAFSVVGGHAIYNYKKLYADFEYMYANGSSGIYYGQGRSHGLYSTLGYFITPKLELLARYDFFQNLENDKVSQEYTAGLTYYFHPRVKLMLNYIYAMNDTSSEPSHKFYIGADFLSPYILDLL